MISRLCIGLLWALSTTALAQRRPPNYSQDRMPVTSFSCRDKIIGGYYADPETDCQMFHVCVKVPGQGIQDYKFLCPNETAFDQENQICDDWFNIDCEASTLYYSDNFDLYRIGSDFPGSNQSPRLPSNNINNAVSENEDDFYLQKSDRGENIGSDLLRGSHSSNFYSNRNRGRENDEDEKENNYKKTNKNNVRKLLTGKRPIASTQAPVENYPSTSAQYQTRTHNNNYSSRTAQFRGHARNQQTPSTVATEAPSRQTESYNRGQPYHRNYYSTTTPKAETTTYTQRTEYFRNYNPTTKRNFYESTQNANDQTTRNYYNLRVTTTTVQPPTIYTETTALDSARNNYYETQKLYKLNTGAFNQYEEPKDEFLKTAQSQNLGASAFNSLQNSYKSLNTSVSASYNFIPTQKQTTNYQSQTYFTQSTQPPNYIVQTTLKPVQQNNYYTATNGQFPQQNYQTNYYNISPLPSSTVKVSQNIPTTARPYQQAFTQATQTPFQQHNPTTTVKSYQQEYKTTTLKTFQQAYNQPSPKPFQQQFSNQQNSYQSSPLPQHQQVGNFQSPKNPTANTKVNNQPQRNAAAKQTYQREFQPQRNPSQFQQTSTYYNPTTPKTYQPIQTTLNAKVKITDTTEQPRPFAQGAKSPEKKEKEQYDYAYYDDGTQSEYDNLEPLEEFKRTKSKN